MSSEFDKYKVTLLKDDGLYKHLKIDGPVEIMTWPGYLAITGGMGDFVFHRMTDMFKFFRGEFSPDYWAHKVSAEGRHEKLFEYAPDVAAGIIAEARQKFTEDVAYFHGAAATGVRLHDFAAKVLDDLDELTEAAQEGDIEFGSAAEKFNDKWKGLGLLEEAWDVSLMRPSHYFLWCCRAIQWVIGQYDRGNCLERQT